MSNGDLTARCHVIMDYGLPILSEPTVLGKDGNAIGLRVKCSTTGLQPNPP